jgi:hypothetical protein
VGVTRAVEHPIRAWVVDDDEHSTLVFATSYPAARRLGAEDLEIDWDDVVDCRRCPEADDLPPGTNLREWQLDHGWRFECSGPACYAHVYGDSDGYVIQNGEVFCSQKCCDELETLFRERVRIEGFRDHRGSQ